MSWLRMQSGRTVGKMRTKTKQKGGISPNACNRGSRNPSQPYPLGKYRLWDAGDPTGLREAAELKRAVVPDRKGEAAGKLVPNYINRSR